MPAALEDSIHEDNVSGVKASIIVEGANAPTTPEAHRILVDRGVLIVPDILANAGGVTVSYFEWAQNIQQFKWDEERVNQELDKKMSRAYQAVRATATQHDTDLRTAAFVAHPQRLFPPGKQVESLLPIPRLIGQIVGPATVCVNVVEILPQTPR